MRTKEQEYTTYMTRWCIVVIIVIILFILSGCQSNYDAPSGASTNSFDVRKGSKPLVTVEIDSCEYLYGAWGNATVLTHKGNCKRCEKRKNNL